MRRRAWIHTDSDYVAAEVSVGCGCGRVSLVDGSTGAVKLIGRTVQRPELIRVGFLGAALFVFTDGPLFYVSNTVLNRPVVSWSDEVVAGGLTAAAAACGALVVWDLWRSGGRRPRLPCPSAGAAVGAFVALAAASTVWSVDEVLHTGWRSAVYAGLALLAWQLADHGDRVWQPLALMAGAGVAASLAAVAVDPTAGIDANGDWQGIYHSRNLLAPVAAVGVIAGARLCWAGGWRMGKRATRVGWALGLPSLLIMFYAGSRTAWLALAAGAGLTALPVMHHRLARHWDERRARAAAWAVLAAGVAAAGALSPTLWNTPTFAQRRTIWQVSWEQFLERPLHGHGFAAVWSWPEFVDNHNLLDRGSAHNGLLEVLLGLGLLGLVPFAAIVVLAVRNAGRDLLRRPGPDTWMWAAVVAVMLIENATESFILRFSYNWVIIMAAALRTPGGRRRTKAQASASG